MAINHKLFTLLIFGGFFVGIFALSLVSEEIKQLKSLTKEFKHQHTDSLQDKETIPHPKPFVEPVGQHSIKHIKNHHIEKKPDQRMD